MRCLANLTPVLWEQNCKGAFFQNACWIIFLCEGWDSPVVDSFMIPRLVLLVLQTHKELDWQPLRHQTGCSLQLTRASYFAFDLRRPSSVRWLLFLVLGTHTSNVAGIVSVGSCKVFTLLGVHVQATERRQAVSQMLSTVSTGAKQARGSL